MITHILFDLDGTLVDTAPEISDAVNLTLARLRRPPVSEALVREWIGDGSRELLRRALRHGAAGGPDVPPLQDIWPQFEADYGQTCGTRSRVYPGVRPGLSRLRAQGRNLVLVTNKESLFAHRVLARHDLASYFDLVVGGDTLAVRKPDPAVVHHVLDTLGGEADECLFVGDSVTDVMTARAAGIDVWAVSYGYHNDRFGTRHQPDRLIDGLEVLADLPRRMSIA